MLVKLLISAKYMMAGADKLKLLGLDVHDIVVFIDQSQEKPFKYQRRATDINAEYFPQSTT